MRMGRAECPLLPFQAIAGVRYASERGTLGALAASPVAISVLSRAQALTGERGRASEVLIKPLPGQAAAFRDASPHRAA